MGRRIFGVVMVAFLAFTACSDSKTKTATASSSAAATGSGAVTVQVDNKADGMNFQAIAYYPNELTVAQGSTLKFHSNFEGEPHTVTFGDSINKAFAINATLTPEQQQGPPPPEIAALKIPFVIDFATADFSNPGSIVFNQSAAQPCVTKTGEFAPGVDPCPVKTADAFDGTQPFFNSGLLKPDQTFEMKLADNIAPGVYNYFCLFHGPDMSGKVTVVPKGDATAQNAAAVDTAGKKQLADEVDKMKPVLDKAKTDAKPGQVTAGFHPDDPQAKFGAMDFIPADTSIPVGGSVTWNLSFHTVAFNSAEDARPDIVQDSDGKWHFNTKALSPSGYTPPPPPASSGSGGPPASDAPPPPPRNVDGGTFDGTSFFNSGSLQIGSEDVFFKLTFSKAGTYNYVCLIHPDMKGTVKVG